ncbi:MAG: hypothetical protein LBD31_04405 [Treponema sp.]|jgi:hypothetical protein|nr:hypothetical protein [Treponema sp.]
MKSDKIQEIAAVAAMLIFVCLGYMLFSGTAFTGTEAQGTHIWLSASTVKFVNNWLKEGPLNLRFIMYEYPRSIEFTDLAERGAYISYPPGAVLPPYILAKLLGKTEIQVGFIKRFLAYKFLLDTLLVCLTAYSIFRWTLRRRGRIMAAFVSVVIALSWMCFPINLYYLRNVYFADQGIIPVVLIFILLELYNDYFTAETQRPFLKYPYLALKCMVSLYGVLTDWYFLFVIFVSWLVRIMPLLRTKNAIKKAVLSSWVYVLPVFAGMGLFGAQIMTVPGFGHTILHKMKYRMFSGDDWGGGNKLAAIAKMFAATYSFGIILAAALVLLGIRMFVIKRREEYCITKYKELFDIMLMIYVPPVLQVLVLQQHSAVHEFSMLKFGLPVILVSVMIPFLALELKGMSNANFVIRVENESGLQKITVPVFYSLVTIVSVLLAGSLGADKSYLAYRMGKPVSYEREYLIRDNYNFNDLYFSFTESIEAFPPQFLAIANKLVYKIGDISEIHQKFTGLSPAARMLLLVNKDDSQKTEGILEAERNTLRNAAPVFSSEHYAVYALDMAP